MALGDGPCPFCGTPEERFDGHVCEDALRQRCFTACAASLAGLPCACTADLDALHAKDVNAKEEQ